MRRSAAIAAVMAAVAVGVGAADAPKPDKDGWYSLFDGKTLDGWKASENPATFKVEDGVIVVNGNRAHLFYTGPVQGARFKNFEFKADVMTFPKANSGIYFHTEYQEKGWPGKGYECQVNTTHSDPKKTGGLYGVKDVFEAPSKDEEWFHYVIRVKGKRIVIQINDKTLVDYVEPDDVKGGRRLSSGTFALQGHDPGSKVLYKNIFVKPLPDE